MLTMDGIFTKEMTEMATKLIIGMVCTRLVSCLEHWYNLQQKQLTSLIFMHGFLENVLNVRLEHSLV